MIIDFHTHTFPDKIAATVAETLSDKSHTAYYYDFSAPGLSKTMKENGVDYCVNLPVMTTVKQVEKVNTTMIEEREKMIAQGIINFGGMHPDYGDEHAMYQELKRLKENGIPGIKIHPAYQNADLDDIRFLRMLSAATELDLIVVTHSGMDIGVPDHNYASPDMILHVINQIHPTKLVLAHMGGWGGWKQVEEELAGAPVWFDTAFSLGQIEAKAGQEDLLETKSNMDTEAFVQLCRAHGTDKILFATDCPWANQAIYVDTMKTSDLTEEELAGIFSGNALKLLNMKL